jgi:hypothetical protein
LEASAISFSRIAIKSVLLLLKNLSSFVAISLCSSSTTQPTQGAATFPIPTNIGADENGRD